MTYGTVNADLMTTSDGVSSAGLYGFKNRIINGAMVIDQRNAGASVTPTTNPTYTLDRWVAFLSQASKYSVQQSTTTATPYKNSLLVTSLSAYTVGASEQFSIAQLIEGLNTYDLAWGTANAATITLSFWVRSSLTGTFGGVIKNSAEDRVYPFTYTINSANTFEQKSITIVGDTTGTWLTTNGVGMKVAFSLGAGATVSTTAGTWGAGNYWSATGATSVVGTSGATFYITGVQLEKGSTATSFDYRPYGTELVLCQRYYFRITPGAVTKPLTQSGWIVSGNSCIAHTKFPVTMRTAPTALEQSGTANQYSIVNLTSVYTCNAVPTFTNANTESSITTLTTASAITAGQGGAGYTDSTNGATAYLGWSAEL